MSDTPARPGAPRWMKILLVGSLGLNLLVAGAVLGAVIDGGGKWRGGPGGPGGAGAFARALSDEDRHVLKRRMVRQFMSERDGRKAFRDEIDGLTALLRADRYDAGAAAERMARLRGLFDGRLQSAQALLVAYWGEMSAQDRAAYADRLEAEVRRGTR